MELNSATIIHAANDDISINFFIYHLNNNGQEINPIGVLSHELGHAVHVRAFNNDIQLPKQVVQFLKELCFPKIDECTVDEQQEIFADVLGMGMLHDSPYAKSDMFPQIRVSDKKVFNSLFSSLLKRMQ